MPRLLLVLAAYLATILLCSAATAHDFGPDLRSAPGSDLGDAGTVGVVFVVNNYAGHPIRHSRSALRQAAMAFIAPAEWPGATAGDSRLAHRCLPRGGPRYGRRRLAAVGHAAGWLLSEAWYIGRGFGGG